MTFRWLGYGVPNEHFVRIRYTATDVFAAGFEDNCIGRVLGTSKQTGAGGANVWDHQTILSHMGIKPTLPEDASFTVAVRRATRVRARAEAPLEDFGVSPPDRHDLTRRDVLEGNCDLLATAVAMLEGGPAAPPP